MRLEDGKRLPNHDMPIHNHARMSQVSGPPSLRVFLSSPYEDLNVYVHAAEEVLSECVEVDHFKHWEATGRPSVPVCRDRVRACDALVVLVGKTTVGYPASRTAGTGARASRVSKCNGRARRQCPCCPSSLMTRRRSLPTRPRRSPPPERVRRRASIYARKPVSLARGSCEVLASYRPRGAYQWAELMRRTFGLDVLACLRWGGRVRLGRANRAGVGGATHPAPPRSAHRGPRGAAGAGANPAARRKDQSAGAREFDAAMLPHGRPRWKCRAAHKETLAVAGRR